MPRRSSPQQKTKCCKGCERDLPLEKYRSRPNGAPYHNCKGCEAERARQYRAQNPEKLREVERKRWEKHKEKRYALAYAWRRSNREWCREYARNFHQMSLERDFEGVRKRQRATYHRNKPTFRACAAARRAREKKAAPDWLDREARKRIRIIYEACAEKASATGVGHHVDHIVPLAGERVCGLHVPWNLRIVTAEENRKKGNKFSQEECE